MTNITDIERKLLDIFDAVPFGMSKFQIEKLIVPQDSPERTYRTICVNAHAKYTALKEATFRRERTKIQLDKLKEYFGSKDKYEDKLKKIDIEEKEYQLWIEEKLIRDCVIELEIYIALLERLAVKLGGLLTRAQFDASEPEYWKKRAIRQAERDMLSIGTISEGNIEFLQQIEHDPLAVKMELKGILEAHGNKLIGEQKKLESSKKDAETRDGK